MSNFNQNKQKVGTQLNVAGNVILNNEESVIWIFASNSDRYFERKHKERLDKALKFISFSNLYAFFVARPIIKKMADYDSDIKDTRRLLNVEKDFCAVVQDEKNNKVVEEKFNPGETIKINLHPGKYTVVIITLIDESRKRYKQEMSNFLSIPVTNGEVINLNFDTVNLKFNFSN